MGWTRVLQGVALAVVVCVLGCDDEPDAAHAWVMDESMVSMQRGMARGACQVDADCPHGATCSAGYGECVRACRSDADCAAPNRCLTDRLEMNVCGCDTADCGAPAPRF